MTLKLDYQLLPYQEKWVRDKAPVKVCEKGRRVGITWASAYAAVLESSLAKENGGMDTYYISYNEGIAHEFIEECGEIATKLNKSFSILRDEKKDVLRTRITFRKGCKIQALTSKASNFRGREGHFLIDEGAFHENLSEVIKAAVSTMIRGGRVSIISTHKGVNNEFYRLTQEIKEGKLDYSLHTVPFEDAVKQGLYRQICAHAKQEWTKEKENAWKRRIRKSHGDFAKEELDCIPVSSFGNYIKTDLIERSSTLPRVIARLYVDEKFNEEKPEIRKEKTNEFLHQDVLPFLYAADPEKSVDEIRSKTHKYIGIDYGRKHDLTSIALGYIHDGSLQVSMIIELKNVPLDNQMQIIKTALKSGFIKVAIDATGAGAAFAEILAGDWGSKVEKITLTDKWYSENLPKLRLRFEKEKIKIPDYDELRRDLSLFELINGIPKLPKSRSGGRHGDSGMAVALLNSIVPDFAYVPYSELYQRLGKESKDKFLMFGGNR